MKYGFNQYYYTAAPDLFSQSRKSGWGIFGSSTPDQNTENERVEQISKACVPMQLEEEEAFPVEYVMFCEDRYIAGGAISCGALIEGDNRPNTWTHVMVPEKRGEESFLPCLSVHSFDNVQRESQKIRLNKVMVPYDTALESRSGLKSWEDEKTDACFLRMILAGMTGTGRILITDEDLPEDDFEGYQKLARKVMYHIYSMLPGCWRKELNFIAPMMPKYFRRSSEKPAGAGFYFGPEDPQESYDLVISMQQGRELEIHNFYDSMLARMIELFHEHDELYEEIGKGFQKEHHAVSEKDYIWHFIFEMVERGISADWAEFGPDEYQEAYDQAWKDAEKRKKFLKLTDVLLNSREDIAASADFFAIYCRMLHAFSGEWNPEVWEDAVRQTVRWIIKAEDRQENLPEQYLQMVSEAGIPGVIEEEIQAYVMQKSTEIQKNAEEILDYLSAADEMELWWTAYAPLKDIFAEKIEQKLSDLLLHAENTDEKEKILNLKDQIFGDQDRSAMSGQSQERPKAEEKQGKKQETGTASDEELLELLLSLNDSQNQEQYHYVLDHISSRISQCETLEDKVQFDLLCFYYICYPDASREKKNKFWQLCTLEWFPELEKLLQDPAGKMLEDVLNYEDMPFEGKLFFLYHSSMAEPLEDARRAVRRQLKTFSTPERETAKHFFSREDAQVRRILIQELNYSDKNQKRANIQLVIKSAFWIAAVMAVYEGIQQLDRLHPIAAVTAGIVIMAGCLVKLFMLMKKKKETVRDDMLLFGGLLWISCGAVIRALCGVTGAVVYLAALLVISFAVLLTSGRRDR